MQILRRDRFGWWGLHEEPDEDARRPPAEQMHLLWFEHVGGRGLHEESD